MRRTSSAFSLVELSIVLVILGLLVGGVLSGQSLIRAAELRSVSTDFGRYQAALNSFRDKYFSIPGDMNNGTQFWGRLAAVGSCVTNSGAAVNATTGVCDGDGDGYVYVTGTTSGQSYEVYEAWRELANASMIEGNYTGVSTGTYGIAAGVNAPRSKVDGTGLFSLVRLYPGSYSYSASIHYSMDYGNVLGVTQANTNGVLKPEEAWNIDTKMDDGKPATGKLIAVNWDTCTTSATNTDFAGTYDFTVTSKACALGMKNAI